MATIVDIDMLIAFTQFTIVGLIEISFQKKPVNLQTVAQYCQ